VASVTWYVLLVGPGGSKRTNPSSLWRNSETELAASLDCSWPTNSMRAVTEVNNKCTRPATLGSPWILSRAAIDPQLGSVMFQPLIISLAS